VNIAQQLNLAQQQLAAIVEAPRLEAEILLAHVLHKERSFLYAWPAYELDPQALLHLNALIKRRLTNEPLAYIVGYKEFWSLQLLVTKDTLIPRPETEILVENILKRYDSSTLQTVLDLGTGSGAIALALAFERPKWSVYAVDKSEAALQIAKKNAEHLSLAHIIFLKSDWCLTLPQRKFDIIVSNPPYIAETEWEIHAQGLAFEPRVALLSGRDGLDAIRKISSSARSYLEADGNLFLEHGFKQASAVQKILLEANYKDVQTFTDLQGHGRVTTGRF
jgi:release factor glutamine methyltransferase